MTLVCEPTSPFLQHAFDYWQRKYAASEGLPYRRDIDIVDLKPCLSRTLLLELAVPIENSRYRVFGTQLVDYFNEELTNQLLCNVGSVKNRILIDEYAAVVGSGEARLFSNDPVIGDSVFRYEKIALPLLRDDGEIGYILAVIDQLVSE